MLRFWLALPVALFATPALAQTTNETTDIGITDPPSSLTVSGTAALVSDYRFRGVSQSDDGIAAQGSLTVSHDSGFYAGAWGSTLAGWGEIGGADVELDLYAGYRRALGNATVDAGLLWYIYPGADNDSDFVELYADISGTLGPATVKLGTAYAPRQDALANVSAARDSRGWKQDNLYLFADATAAIVGTPLTARAHIGYSDGNPGLGPNGTSLAPTGRYFDYSIGVDATRGAFTLGLAYTDTDIGRAESLRLQPRFSKGQDGTGSIADGAIIVSLTAAF